MDIFTASLLAAAGYVAYVEVHAELETNREVKIIKASALSKTDVGPGGSLISMGIDPDTNMLKFHFQPPPMRPVILPKDTPPREIPFSANGQQIGTITTDHPFRADALELVEASIAAPPKDGFGPQGAKILGTSNPACPFYTQVDRWSNAVHGYLIAYGVAANNRGTWATRSAYSTLERLYKGIIDRAESPPLPEGV